jgi:hypothetical protein
MEVILREHVEHLGERGQIVKVADGYARNYLLPRKLALPATEGNRRHVERRGRPMPWPRAWPRSTSPSPAASATPSSCTAR